jgi:hypothetical protein
MSALPKPSLKAIVAQSAPPAPLGARVRRHAATPPHRNPAGTLKERARQLSVYLEPPAYDRLREIAHCERTKMHALMLEALDLLFLDRGVRAISELERQDDHHSLYSE